MSDVLNISKRWSYSNTGMTMLMNSGPCSSMFIHVGWETIQVCFNIGWLLGHLNSHRNCGGILPKWAEQSWLSNVFFSYTNCPVILMMLLEICLVCQYQHRNLCQNRIQLFLLFRNEGPGFPGKCGNIVSTMGDSRYNVQWTEKVANQSII